VAGEVMAPKAITVASNGTRIILLNIQTMITAV
jgi:hypothetical protein